MEDIVLASFDYTQLDAPDNAARIRLGHTVAWVRNTGDGVAVGILDNANGYPVTMGGYRCATDPSEPILVHMVHVPTVPTASDPRAALRAARKKLFALKIEDYEHHIRDDLTRMLGPGGFDAHRDIAAITVNRWSHGYAYGPHTLTESADVAERTMLRARVRVGRVTIAGSDAGWDPYAHAAFEQASRAVSELS